VVVLPADPATPITFPLKFSLLNFAIFLRLSKVDFTLIKNLPGGTSTSFSEITPTAPFLKASWIKSWAST